MKATHSAGCSTKSRVATRGHPGGIQVSITIAAFRYGNDGGLSKTHREVELRPAIYLYSFATVAAGVVDLIWGDFERAHQPIQTFGDNIPPHTIFAYAVALGLIVGGVAILSPRSARWGAVMLGAVYTIFAIFWLPRLYTAPHIIGQHVPVYIGVLGGVGTQVIVAAAAAIVYAASSKQTAEQADRTTRIVRWVFGLCAIAFGLAHLTGISGNEGLVPGYMPLGQAFWTVFTGVAFVLAGIAFVTTILDVLAARLLAAMFFVFSVLALAPLIFTYPHAEGSWGTNAYNLAAVASAWIFAQWLAARRSSAAGPATTA